MITKSKRMTMLFHEYEQHIGRPGRLDDAIEWGLAHGKISMPSTDPRAILRAEMKDALRAETRRDAQGREYRANAALTFTRDGGVQEHLWGDTDRATTPREYMAESFAQRRKGIVDDCVKLKIDVDHYNETRGGAEPIQLVLDFADDVAEREAVRDAERAA